MYNYYYIIYSFIILGSLYLSIFLYKTYASIIFLMIQQLIKQKPSINNKDFNNTNNKSTNNTNKKITLLKKQYNIVSTENTKNIYNINKSNLKFINIPPYLNINEYTNIHIAPSIYNNFDKTNMYMQPIINSYVQNKLCFEKIFMKNGAYIIKDLDSFYLSYNSIIKQNSPHNIILKFTNGNVNDDLYINMKSNILIKIKNTNPYKEIFSKISKDKIFIMNNNENYYMSIGNYFESKINSDNIKNIFFNKINLNNKITNEYKNYEKLIKYSKIIIIYWTTTQIII